MARAGCKYFFVPVLIDRNLAPSGTLVRVVPATGLGVSGRLPSRFAYIEHLDGTIIGMVCAASLHSRAAYKARLAEEAAALTRVND
jgi:hypothetical protein